MQLTLGIRLVAVGVGALAALAPATGLGATAPLPGLVYAAETAQFEVVNAEVSAARNRVTKFNFGWSAECVLGPGATPTTSNATAWTEYRGGYAINKAGRWSTSFKSNRFDGTVQQAFTHKLSGIRTSGKMSGTIQVTLVEADAAGQHIRTCASPTIKYSALEKTMFGGLTVGQKNLILVKLTLTGKQVKRFRWDWSGTCTLGPAAKPETSATAFERDFLDGPLPIKANGSFAADFGFDPVPNTTTGITTQFRVKLVGRKSGRTIKGTVTGGFLETDTATGGVIRDCTSPAVKFNVKD